MLAGQPELDEKLDSFELRQLKQRVALRCHLDPLNHEETKGYIQRRLQIAGAAAGNTIFSDPAMSAVFRHAKGFPRMINTICENALLCGYAKRATTIPAEVIEEIAADLRLDVVVSREDKTNGASRAAKEKEKDELLRAVKTLLELHDYLQEMKSADAKESTPVLRTEHEPYI